MSSCIERYNDELQEKRARLLSGLVCILNFLFFVGFMASLALFSMTFAGWVLKLLPVLLVIPIITSICTLGVIIMNLKAKNDKYWTLFGRIHYTMITLSMLAFIWFLNYWNLLGFHY